MTGPNTIEELMVTVDKKSEGGKRERGGRKRKREIEDWQRYVFIPVR